MGMPAHHNAKEFASLRLAQSRPCSGRRIDCDLMYQSFISLALLVAAFLVAGFFAYIYSIKRQSYLLLWTAAWFVFGLHYIAPASAQAALSSSLENALTHWLYALAAVLFFLGAQIYAQRKPWKIPALLVVIVLGVWAVANATSALSISAVIPASLIYIGVAAIFWQESRRQ